MKKWLGMFTPLGMVVRAGLLVVAFGAAHLAGWRAATSFICGTAPTAVTRSTGGR